MLRVLFIGLVLISHGKPGSRDGASAGKRRIWYPGSCPNLLVHCSVLLTILRTFTKHSRQCHLQEWSPARRGRHQRKSPLRHRVPVQNAYKSSMKRRISRLVCSGCFLPLNERVVDNFFADQTWLHKLTSGASEILTLLITSFQFSVRN